MGTKAAPEYPDRIELADEPQRAPFRPFIPPEVSLPELTPRAIVTGALLGIVFGASSLYLVLKVGITVSASIPVAVISIALFRILSQLGVRDASILENNIVQTGGSAGESIAFGVGVTMPAIIILGFDLEVTRVMLVAVLGGLLGILMMIPLRRALIVQQHGRLKYPEGTACAEVLKAAASDEERELAARRGGEEAAEAGEAPVFSGARTIFIGFGIGLAYKAAMVAFKAWRDIPQKVFGAPFRAGSVSAEISPELLGVGYIIGPRIAATMCAGGVLAYLVLIPAIKFFGQGISGVVAPGTVPIAEMGPDEIRGAYVLYIGAGAVATGGIISLLRSGPMIWHGIRHSISDYGSGKAAAAQGSVGPRTELDLPLRWVGLGILALVALIVIFPTLHMNVIGAGLVILFGFLFVTVSSRLTGEVGSTSNPISGMTYATLILTCLIFLSLGWTEGMYFVTALSVGGIVCVASSNGGTTSQDLKTGFLVGATPRSQQIAILIGALISALMLGPILLRLNDAATVYVPRITFEQVEGAPALEATAIGNLQPYTETVAPPRAGAYRVLEVQPEREGAPQGELDPGTYLVTDSGTVAYRRVENFPATLRTEPSRLTRQERIRGVQAGMDERAFRVWHKTDTEGAPPGRYLVDERGTAVYLVDPGINGVHPDRPDGSRVNKFDAPKAVLVSYIIKGILSQELPWALVLLGVMIAIVLEMAGINALVFAVGVYLPLSTSSPIFIGGLVRWLVDSAMRRRLVHRRLTEEQLAALGDSSPGVLMASGYIAGGAIAGIVIAFMAGVLTDFDTRVREFMLGANPLYNGPWADALSLIPFAALIALLYLTGREMILARKPPTA
ncbi:MAG TPA: oligopeptide transporter, OPT family [Gemmatimonadota bacterium]|nr:oligopeptide transporter, OPT family [Gemmatimonadota bacterium]